MAWFVNVGEAIQAKDPKKLVVAVSFPFPSPFLCYSIPHSLAFWYSTDCLCFQPEQAMLVIKMIELIYQSSKEQRVVNV